MRPKTFSNKRSKQDEKFKQNLKTYLKKFLKEHERFDKTNVRARLKELSEVESEILSELHPEPRMHS